MSKPKIRFKGFEDDWEQRKLGDIAEFSKGSGYSKGDLIESGTPIILYGRLYTKYETSISEVDTYVEAKDGSVYSKGGEVIVPASGETAEDIARAATVDKSGVILGGDLNVVSPNEDINSAFLAISISHGNSQRELAKKAQGKSVVHIHNEEIKNLVVPFPAKVEQNKIVEYFSNLDNLITLHQRRCDETKKLKKFMLQKMFPQNEQNVPEIRFKGFTDPWEQRKLIEVCDYVDYRGKTPTKTENGIFLVTAKNVKDGFIDYETSKEYISENAYEEVMRRGKPEIGDVLITTEAPCGNVAQVNKADIALAQRIIKYRGHIGVVDNTYLKYYLLSPEFQKILNAKSSGGTVQGIKGSILHQQKIIYPSYEEQKKIGQHMDSLDHLITLHQHKCDELQKIKKFMLQKMFVQEK